MNRDQQTHSIWSDGVMLPRLATFEGHLDVDVAVVGAGITGMTTAALLKKAGMSVAVVERQLFGQHGTTHRTSAHLTARLDQSYSLLIRNFGEKTARIAVTACQSAIDLIEQLASEGGFENEFRRVDGYQFTENPHETQEIEDDFNAARRLGMEVELIDSIPLNIPISRGFRVRRQAQFHPIKHVAGLAQFVDGDGSFVFHNSPVRAFEDGERCHLRLDTGTITAKHIVLATHTPMGVWMTLQTRLVPYHSYCIAATLNKPAPAGLFWDNADPYHYIRRFEPDDGNTLIIGGADTKTGHDRDTRSAFERIERYARQRFDVKSIDRYWSAQFFEPADGMPYIGRAPGQRHVYVATGYSGTGLTYGTTAALLISELILGRANACEEAFTPRRIKPVASAKHVMEEFGATVKGMVADRLFNVAAKDVSDLNHEEGRLVTSRGKRLAVYRDKNGTLHACSATCTHLGCLVEWNNAEKHWDCKCHGSLFHPETGEPMGGPATKPLARHELTETHDESGVSRGVAAKSKLR